MGGQVRIAGTRQAWAGWQLGAAEGSGAGSRGARTGRDWAAGNWVGWGAGPGAGTGEQTVWGHQARPRRRGPGARNRGRRAHLTDLLGEEKQLRQAHAVPGQVVPQASQGHVLHDQLHRLLA